MSNRVLSQAPLLPSSASTILLDKWVRSDDCNGRLDAWSDQLPQPLLQTHFCGHVIIAGLLDDILCILLNYIELPDTLPDTYTCDAS